MCVGEGPAAGGSVSPHRKVDAPIDAAGAFQAPLGKEGGGGRGDRADRQAGHAPLKRRVELGAQRPGHDGCPTDAVGVGHRGSEARRVPAEGHRRVLLPRPVAESHREQAGNQLGGVRLDGVAGGSSAVGGPVQDDLREVAPARGVSAGTGHGQRAAPQEELPRGPGVDAAAKRHRRAYASCSLEERRDELGVAEGGRPVQLDHRDRGIFDV
mmetsp:Transcript_100722/g.262574  ORF Transcript_100722/g.262574 Transcript_100722/m.262574 type:complete len:212 (-) Transcript_100722:107-742(-)